MINPKIFRVYDVRGTYPDQMNEDSAYRIAKAFAQKIKPKKIVVGQDLRDASSKMKDSVIQGLVEMGVDVDDAGKMTNPMIGFANFYYGYDGAIILSASHNPIGYGGMKMTRKNAVTVPGDDPELLALVQKNDFRSVPVKGKLAKKEIIDDYVKFVRSFVDIDKLEPKKIIFDATFGSVCLVLDKILDNLPVQRIDLHTEPDKNFGGLPEPNPLNKEVQKEALELAVKEKPDFTVMWDGDGDRVFFLDEKGNFVHAPYITAVLVEFIAGKYPSQPIVCDQRIIWPIQKAAREHKVECVLSKSGYRFLKETMSQNNASFGAEMTAHYFFEKTKYMDNGVIPFLMIWQIISESGRSLSELVAPYKDGHFMIDEVKFQIEDLSVISRKIKDKYSDGKIDEVDGITIEYPDWRFNFRGSNTEPVAKLNLEAKDRKLMEEKTQEIKDLIGQDG
jgi:phosphomannomutase